jgi:hypothetical protein
MTGTGQAQSRLLFPDIGAFEERSAISEYGGGLPRPEAEDFAAQAQGFLSAGHYWQWFADYVVKRGVK